MVKKTKAKETVLRVEHVSKNFHLPHEKDNSIKSRIVNVFKPKDTEVDVQHALKDISFDIKKGEFFGILGRNGSGKSTLLKILAEIYQPTAGSVHHYGKLVPFIELGVGFNPELTGRENVYLNGALLGFSRKEIDARYREIVEFAELEDFMDQKLKNYSSGMQVRLAFSVATHAEADILLVDEVLAVGDADFQRKCYDFFKSLKKSKKTVIFVTHDMGAVREYCDRAILIKDGLIAHEGKADKIADEYLKLFNVDSEGESEDAAANGRWGTGDVRMEKVSVTTRSGSINIHATLKSRAKDISGVVFGYKFLDAEGRVVMGGNTLNAAEGKANIDIQANQSKYIGFQIPNILGTGTYNFTATVRLADGATVCDNWDNITTVKVTKNESYYPIIAPAKMEIE